MGPTRNENVEVAFKRKPDEFIAGFAKNSGDGRLEVTRVGAQDADVVVRCPDWPGKS